MQEPKRILVISPYSGDVRRNLSYLEHCLKYVIAQGHAPFAPHWIYPQYLDDKDPDQRELGLHMGLAWGEKAQEIWIFRDLGETEGMAYEIGYYKMNFTDIPMKSFFLLDGDPYAPKAL